MKKTNRINGFTLVELMVVIGIISALTAILIPTFFDMIERANNTADLTNIHNIINAVNRAFIMNEDDGFYDNVWGSGKGHEDNYNMGYIYVDNDEVRVSNPAIADLLVEQGYLTKNVVDKNRGPEPCYTIKGHSKLRCQSSRKWCRYQITFSKGGDFEDLKWGITSATRATTSVNKAGSVLQDPCDEVATREMAERVGVAPYIRKLGNQE